VAIGSRSRRLSALLSILSDPLYRGALTLLVNTAVMSVLGIAFWTLATHLYAPSTIGVFSGVTAGIGLLATIATLGFQNTITRHVASSENPRGLVTAATSVIATMGTTLCLVTVVVLGPHLPAALGLQQRKGMVLLVTVLVVVSAVSTVLDAGLIAFRASNAVLIKNVVASIVKLAALIPLTMFRSSGLLLAYSLGLVVGTGGGGIAVIRRIKRTGLPSGSFGLLRRRLSMTAGNYFATIMGILPATVVPLEVLALGGPTETAHFTAAATIGGFLNFIPSTVAMVFFAEASRHGAPIGNQLRKALRATYGLLLPAIAVVIATAPLLLSVFGASYAIAGADCLRVIALSALPMGGAYMIDSLLIARDRTAAYVFMNGANAALVLGFVAVLVPRGLTAAGAGWTLAQTSSLLLGLVVLAGGRAGRHRAGVSARPTTDVSPRPVGTWRPPEAAVAASEPQIRDMLAAWPAMPTAMIADRIGWGQSAGALLNRVSELRPAYLHADQSAGRSRRRAGETAQCGFWFPPVEIPVGWGQTRTAKQLPVLTMVTGYSRWILAMLIPSRQAEDLFAAWWLLLDALGAVPWMQTWDSERAIGQWGFEGPSLTAECDDFCRMLDTEVIIGQPADPRTRGLVERAHVYLEHSFLPGRTFASPADFNSQLGRWLSSANTRRRRPNLSPADLITEDTQAMLPLPGTPPPTGWYQPMRVGKKPFIPFDSNYYWVPHTTIGHRIELVADLAHVTVLQGRRVVAEHPRCWARGQTIDSQAHHRYDEADTAG